MMPAAENREVSTGTKRFVERSLPLSRSQCRLLILGLVAFSACTGDVPSSALLAPALPGRRIAASTSRPQVASNG